ncbi:MAG: hypothetical protein MPJ50_08170 [Pirellulales bacterium]|nr:hypothetical protein [Pirellulales bacterium]
MLLVVLRIAVGWHFFYEGYWKYSHDNYSAESFLSQAKGPFAWQFQGAVPDLYGVKRLNIAAMRKSWEAFAADVGAHYGFEDQQRSFAQQLIDNKVGELEAYLAEEVGLQEVEKYVLEINKWRADSQDTTIQGIPDWAEQHAKHRDELRARSAAWLVAIDQMDDKIRYQVMAGATPEQVKSQGGFSAPRTELDWINSLTTYGLLAVGGCLILGLFTRLASLCGGLFLASIVLAQPALPWIFPQPHPSAGHAFLVNKEFIEMLALFFLATTRVGRWGGLDYFVHTLVTGPLFGSKKSSER